MERREDLEIVLIASSSKEDSMPVCFLLSIIMSFQILKH